MFKFDASTKEKAFELLESFWERHIYTNYPEFPEDLLDDYLHVFLHGDSVRKLSYFSYQLLGGDQLSSAQKNRVLNFIASPCEAHKIGNVREHFSEFILEHCSDAQAGALVNKMFSFKDADLDKTAWNTVAGLKWRYSLRTGHYPDRVESVIGWNQFSKKLLIAGD